jgi:hypothetical protein
MREVMLALALASTLSGCVHVCRAMQTRCNGPYVEICDEGGRWQRVMNCDDVRGPDGGPWMCCPSADGGHACLPAGECGGGDAR